MTLTQYVILILACFLIGVAAGYLHGVLAGRRR